MRNVCSLKKQYSKKGVEKWLQGSLPKLKLNK